MKYLQGPISVLVFAVLVFAALSPALGVQAEVTLPPGTVVSLQGTPHLWFADDEGVLHWGGDTRALSGRLIDWNKRVEVSLEELQVLDIGDPWLSTGLLKDGDPVYLVKWETEWTEPQLLHIQSLNDVELFGIDSGNYGEFVLDPPTWEGTYGLSADSLVRLALEPATTPSSPAPGTAPTTSREAVLQRLVNKIEDDDDDDDLDDDTETNTATATATATGDQTATATATATDDGTSVTHTETDDTPESRNVATITATDTVTATGTGDQTATATATATATGTGDFTDTATATATDDGTSATQTGTDDTPPGQNVSTTTATDTATATATGDQTATATATATDDGTSVTVTDTDPTDDTPIESGSEDDDSDDDSD